MIVISHRGASAYEPENTITAFKKAVSMGSRAFEFDVQRSKDGKLVVAHDYDFLRTAKNKSMIKELDFSEIQKINVGAYFPGKQFCFAPLLENVISTIYDSADFINLEIKNDNDIYPGIEKDIIDFLKTDSKLFEKTVISSFHFPTLKKIRQISDKARLAYLGHKLEAMLIFPAAKKARAIACENFHISRKISFCANLKLISYLGFNVCVYTVNSQELAKKLQKYEVYGIFSNHPDILEEKTNYE